MAWCHANRGVFGLNELPDLAERIQVALFNVLEERDIQVRGYSAHDFLSISSCSPRPIQRTTPIRGRIICPLGQIRCRAPYPLPHRPRR